MCAICGQEVVRDTQTRTWYGGWAKDRDRGIHGLELAERGTAVAHGHCIDMKKMGLHPGQAGFAL